VIGYPAEDLLLRPNLNKRMQKAFAQLSEVKDIVMVFGRKPDRRWSTL
jgi:NAD+ synthase (glutamine-hydrolysing)